MKLIVCLVIAVSAVAIAEENFLDSFQLSDYIEIRRNDNQVQGRSIDNSVEASLEQYMKNHDAIFKVPFISSTLTLGARNLDEDEVSLKLRFDEDSQVDARKKKTKLKRIFVPFFIFILVKAIVLIPLAIGILAIKTWNALQLGFVSFIVALSLGVWSLCQKISGDNHPHIVAHSAWEDKKYIARALETNDAQNLAYSAYAPQV